MASAVHILSLFAKHASSLRPSGISTCRLDATGGAIYEYLAAWNEAPKPFVWKATADRILAKVKRC